jgi:hypothetical protein
MAHAATLEMPKSRHPVNVKIPSFQAYRSQDELAAMGKALRDKRPRTLNADWKAPAKWPDPVKLVQRGLRKGKLVTRL